MKHRTNRERRARKEAKAIELANTNKMKKQQHISMKDSRPGYRQIISMVKTKIAHFKSQRFTSKGIIKELYFKNEVYTKLHLTANKRN